MQDLVIVCAGEFGEEMVDNIRWINEEEPRWNLLGFIDDSKTGEVAGIKILGKLEDFLKMDRSIQYFVADLDGKVRECVMTQCKAAGFTGAVIFGKYVNLEENVTIGESCYIDFRTTLVSGCQIGRGVIIVHSSAIHAKACIDEYSTLKAFFNAGRNAHVGKHNYFEHGCIVDDNVVTADECCFESGSVVLNSADKVGRYAGIPAKLKAAEQ